MSGNVVGNQGIIDPEAAQPGLAAKNDRSHGLGGGILVVLESDGQIDFGACTRTVGLLTKVVGEMFGIPPGVAVNVDDHRREVRSRRSEVRSRRSEVRSRRSEVRSRRSEVRSR